MSKWTRDEREIYRDLVIAFWHEKYKDMKPIDALAEIRRNRGEYV